MTDFQIDHLKRMRADLIAMKTPPEQIPVALQNAVLTEQQRDRLKEATFKVLSLNKIPFLVYNGFLACTDSPLGCDCFPSRGTDAAQLRATALARLNEKERQALPSLIAAARLLRDAAQSGLTPAPIPFICCEHIGN
jgi:hypothetical protein